MHFHFFARVKRRSRDASTLSAVEPRSPEWYKNKLDPIWENRIGPAYRMLSEIRAARMIRRLPLRAELGAELGYKNKIERSLACTCRLADPRSSMEQDDEPLACLFSSATRLVHEGTTSYLYL